MKRVHTSIVCPDCRTPLTHVDQSHAVCPTCGIEWNITLSSSRWDGRFDRTAEFANLVLLVDSCTYPKRRTR